jgi:hypothetical protein
LVKIRNEEGRVCNKREEGSLRLEKPKSSRWKKELTWKVFKWQKLAQGRLQCGWISSQMVSIRSFHEQEEDGETSFSIGTRLEWKRDEEARRRGRRKP